MAPLCSRRCVRGLCSSCLACLNFGSLMLRLAWCRGTLSALGAACDWSKQAPLSVFHMAAAAVAAMTLAVKLRSTKVAGGGSPCWKPLRLELLPQA